KIATFNIHDLLVVAFDHKARMRAIGEVLTELDPDIVGIQEAFIEADRAVLFEAIEGSRLQYRQYFPSGIAGSGLLTLSAYPIREAFFHRYVQGGKWYKPYHGDWWGGKGVSLARIELPGGACVDFFDTHAQASYWTRNEYLGIRKAQMRELAAFVGASATGAGPAFLVGDMNCRPGAPDFQIAVEQGKLKRVMAVETPIDHIFRVENPRYRFETLDTRPIEGTVDLGGRQSRLSDHTGYMSTVRVTPQ
ncbi:MAG: sphingomyelin phosphodiesterase 2, partial [Candidatus Hydrogenedentes bacterium]|nr:sphingomyelin phosphodiesterase 2 [Candidatus Hydrogenedentota bacterium]